ncbi:hypothetical protein [Caldisericum sp.]|uniref:hypothetical protein n=1 Tax=Caldisericum sp. TaxID=2499687 RepID=UPI003D0D3E23
MKSRISKSTPLEEFADVCMNSLIIVSFVKIILVQKIFSIGNMSFFAATFIFMILLLSKGIAIILRVGVSIYSLYLFFAEISEGTLFFNDTLSLIVAYFGLYLIFRKALFRKNIDVEVVSNSLALATFVKLLYSYFVQIHQYFSLSFILTLSVIIIVLLSIPILEDLSRLIISFFATIDVLLYLYRLSSLFTIAFLILVIVIFGSLIYRLRRTKKI